MRLIERTLLQKSLKARITAYFLLVSLPVVVVLAGVSYALSAIMLEQMAIDRFKVIADYREQEITRFMDDQTAIVEKIANLDALRAAADRLRQLPGRSPDYEAAYRAMEDTLFRSTFLDYGSSAATDLIEILLIDAVEQQVFFSTHPDHEGDIPDNQRFLLDGHKDTYVQPVYPAADSGKPTLTVATPLTNLEGETIGVLAAHIRVPVLVEIVSQRAGLGETGESYLVDTDYRFLSVARAGRETQPGGAHSTGIDAARRGTAGAGLYRNYADVRVIGSYRWLSDLGLALITEISVAEALQPATRLGWMILSLGLLAVLLLAVGIYLISRQIARPILALTATTRLIADGDLSHRAPVLTADETGTLAQNFNHMIERLQTTLDELAAEQQKSERLLLNILPEAIARRLKQGEDNIADSCPEVTILFADIVNFTPMSADLAATELVRLLNEIFSEFDRLCQLRKLEKIKTIGDAYMVGAGLPVERKDHAHVIAEMALDMLDAIVAFNQRHDTDLKMRMGINSGPVVAGVIGTSKFIYDIWGDAVNTAARMESEGIEGCIQVTEATYRYLRNDYRFKDRGMIKIKGKGKMHTYILTGRKLAAQEYVS